MTSFGWKRKAGAKVSKQLTEAFSSDIKDEELETDEGFDWFNPLPRKITFSLEDAHAKSERLKLEGTTLAEAERYWEAIKKWEEAIQLVPTNHTILDMKAQALMAVGEVFPALQAAEKTVKVLPTWWIAHQTLGRALANVGEVKMAQKSFSRAVHLNPGEPELWSEDLLWTKSLLDRHKLSQMHHLEDSVTHVIGSSSKSTVTIRELKENHSNTSADEDENLAVVNYERREEQVSGSDSENKKRIRQLPRNYIQMREPT